MPQVKANIVDGWYRNDSKDAQGNPRTWSAATLSFKPGEVRFVPARARLESRSVNQAFEVALAKGLLVGPAATAAMDGAAAPEPAPAPEPVKAPEPEPEEPTNPGLDLPVTKPDEEPEDEGDDEGGDDDDDNESSASRVTKKRRGRKKS